ncbi:phosphotransferase family protein [Polycyclovorans algicola]|uniref:phosphotransferase family protein n=1 Tax=Polycyclovorans algicola TaxID=616992 RepID=UPI0005BA9762|nr:phosphotransferase family protein [Polycyclovorans algicola]
MNRIDKRYFSDAQIAAIRCKWTVERTIDECLTRKLERRRGDDYALPALPDLTARLSAWMQAEISPGAYAENLKRIPGGGSKEMFFFDLVDGNQRQRRVLRMNPGESIVETHRLREFQVMKAMHGVVPVPEMICVDADGGRLGQSALVCGFVSGVAKSKRPVKGGSVSGIGVGFPAELRAPLFEQFVDHLAAIHRFEWRGAALEAFDAPTPGTTEAVLWNLNSWRRIWEEDSLEDHPVITLAAQWLAANAPVCDDVRLVHNDYRNGNFLFDDDSAQITAILDWEMAHLADVHEDLAWVLFPGFASADDNGAPLVCGLAPRQDFLARYQAASGITPDPARLAYYEIFNTFKLAVLGTASNARAAADRQSHLDVMMNFSTGLGYVTLSLLAAQLRGQGAL